MFRYHGSLMDTPFGRYPVVRVDPSDYPAIFAAEKWLEILNPTAFEWYLLRDVPIERLRPGTRTDWREDCDLDEEDIEENEARYDLIEALIDSGESPWPVIADERGLVLDGYHRLAVLNDHGAESVDVLWVRERAGSR